MTPGTGPRERTATSPAGIFRSLSWKMNLSASVVMVSITELFAVVLVALESSRFTAALAQTRTLLQTLKEGEPPALLSEIQNVETGYVEARALAMDTRTIKSKVPALLDVRLISAVDGRQLAAAHERAPWPVAEVAPVIPQVKGDQRGRFRLAARA